jgi:hypothetical protein
MKQKDLQKFEKKFKTKLLESSPLSQAKAATPLPPPHPAAQKERKDTEGISQRDHHKQELEGLQSERSTRQLSKDNPKHPSTYSLHNNHPLHNNNKPKNNIPLSPPNSKPLLNTHRINTKLHFPSQISPRPQISCRNVNSLSFYLFYFLVWK